MGRHRRAWVAAPSARRGSLVAALLASLALVGEAHAAGLAFSDPFALPGSAPGANGLPGGEPSLVFDPSGDGHAYSVAPGGDERTGVGFWASTDGARSFAPGRSVGSLIGGGDSEVEVGPDHTVYLADLEIAANAICRSHDYGATFGDGCETGLASDQAGPESDREWLTASPVSPQVLYLTYHDFAAGLPIVEQSSDGGSSFSPCGAIADPGQPAFQTALTGGSDVGKPAIARDGSLYVPLVGASRFGGGDATDLYIAVGDGGCAGGFRSTPVYSNPGASLANLFAFASIDGGGNVWMAVAGPLAAGRPSTLDVFVSRDHGHTWSPPMVVSAPGEKAAVFPAIAAGQAPGQAAVGWYSTDSSADPQADGDQWRYYGATTSDFGATWDVAAVTRQPFHYGAICANGVLCTSNRNLLDFSSIAVDPQGGCVVHAFPGDPYDLPGSQQTAPAAAYISRQTAGPCLNASGAGPQATDTGASAGARCHDDVPPRTRFTVHAVRASRRGGLRLAGRTSDRGCGAGGSGRVTRVEVSVARIGARTCRFLTPAGTLGAPSSCRRPRYVAARGTRSWTLRVTHSLPAGRYLARARAVDAQGNVERPTRLSNRLRFRVR